MELVNKLLWEVTSIIIILASIWFSIKLRWPQFKIKKIVSSLASKSSNDVSIIDSLLMSLSSRIGVGSIAGIALAIKYGGIGSIFWIWIITLLISSISYIESLYGAKYKERQSDNTYVGGPHHYIKTILKNKKLAACYAFLIVISYGIGFICIQANTVSVVSNMSLDLNHHLINFIIVLTAMYCLLSNTDKKSKILGKIVPIMTGIYLLLGGWIIISHPLLIINIVNKIIKTAFNFSSLGGGVVYSIIIGMQRAIFSTEVGIGTSAISSAMTVTDEENNGYVQILGNFITTFIICSITAVIILSSNYEQYMNMSTNGIELAYFAFRYHFGSIGNIFILVCIVLFAYSTIISGFYYGESSLQFLTKNKFIKKLYKFLIIIFILISTYISATTIWALIDVAVAILCLINIYAITKIYKKTNN